MQLLVALPEAEDPWPERVGPGFPFTLAAALGLMAGIAKNYASEVQRDRAITRAGALGFWLGVAIYASLLLLQL